MQLTAARIETRSRIAWRHRDAVPLGKGRKCSGAGTWEPKPTQRASRHPRGTSGKLYDDTRKQLARRYLGDPNISIQETAHLLAFGDLRGFYRAFRRWEDCTPAEYRQKLRSPEGASGAAFP